MDRRDFIVKSALSVTGLIIAPALALAQDSTKTGNPTQPAPSTGSGQAEKPAKVEKPPALHPDLVRDFVGAGHNNLDKVKAMLAEEPNLLYAMWDWGGGDFETAIEGAGHVGDREIAEYLISQGTRPNIFVLTMLGKTAIVKGLLEEFPVLLNAKGPHGFTLLHHAERGGEAAAELLEHLASKGLKEKKIPMFG